VLNLRSQTTGGVIRAGDPIMDIVPLDDDLIVVAKLSPRDIDAVTVGLRAHLTLVPFASRNSLPLNGEVTQIAADATVDERTGASYYEMRVRVPAEELASHDGMYLSPGMPADVTVVTGERTMLQYLTQPFLRSLGDAFVYD
jgi:HlyD family type I secretion membrane fusion protein